MPNHEQTRNNTNEQLSKEKRAQARLPDHETFDLESPAVAATRIPAIPLTLVVQRHL
jgi:hypothetical protein